MAVLITGSDVLILILYLSIIRKIKQIGNTRKNTESDQPSSPPSLVARREKSVVINCLVITFLFSALTFLFLYQLLGGNYSYHAVSLTLVALDKLLNPVIYFFRCNGSCRRKATVG